MSMTLQKILAGVLFALMLIKGMDLIIDSFMPAEVEREASKGGGESAGGAQAAAVPDKPLPERLAAADAKKGEQVSAKCASCHTFNAGGPTRVGPNLAGVAGRDKATTAGFAYSDALKKVGGKWDYESLDKWIEKPSAFAPGTKMTFAGIADGQDRANLIAYLKSVSPDAPPFPQ